MSIAVATSAAFSDIDQASFRDNRATVRYETPDQRPIYFGGDSRCENVEIGGDYCVYLDVGYSDGTFAYALKAPFDTGTHGWEHSASVFLPSKPVSEIKAYLLQRKAKGKAWFRDCFVTRTAPSPGAVLRQARRTFRPYRNADRVIKRVWTGKSMAMRSDEEPSTVQSWNPLPAGECAVWVADSMRKVTPLTFPNDAERAAPRIEVELVGGECESAQVCISTGDSTSLEDVTLRISSLTGRDGTGFAGRVKWERIGYFPRTLAFFRHPLAPRDEETWMPEPLLPAAAMSVPKGGTQGAWLTVQAERGAKAGTYAGEVEVLCGGRTLARIPLSVQVQGFSLPERFGLKTAYSVMDGFTRAAYPNDFAVRRRESWDIMLDHRLNPDDISRTSLPDLELLEHARRRGMNSFCTLHLVPPPKDPNAKWVCYAEPDAIFNETFYSYLQKTLPPYIAELERRGLKDMAYLYGFDERESEYYPKMLEMWKRIKGDFGLPLFTTSRNYRDVQNGSLPFESPLATMTDIFCPSTETYSRYLSDRYRALGKEVWWYTCFSPRYPYANNAHYEYPTVECRLIGWMTWMERADGYLFWLVNGWNSQAKLDESATYFPDWDVSNALDAPGDGMFIYPGKNGVLPGIRLANVRDGVEDYEWLQLAERRGGRMDAEAAAKSIIRTMTDFERDPGKLRTARRQVADAISRHSATWITPSVTDATIRVAAFRRDFTNAADVVRAQLRVSSLGTFNAYLNGSRVGEDWLAPGCTYNVKCRHEATYDILPEMRRGRGDVNAFAFEVGPPWWCDAIAKEYGGKRCALRVGIELEYSDGRHETVRTDGGWKGGYPGPIVDAGIYEGETYDARCGTAWRTGDVSAWPNVVESKEFKGEVRPMMAPVRERKDLEPKADCANREIRLLPGKQSVVDFGQNHAGVVSFAVRGPRGAKVTVRFAEMLNDSGYPKRGNDGPKGSPYLRNLRSAKAEVRYVLSGEGLERYRTSMSYFGYRYASFMSDAPVSISSVRSHVLTGVLKERGRIRTGNALVNRLIANCEWGHYSNYLSVPTDCPQRDERVGWAGDTQVFCKTAMYHADSYGFLMKWLADQRDCQRADGGIPEVAPKCPWETKYGQCGWADSAVIVPYTLWKMYGSLEPLRMHWDSMRRHFAFAEKNGLADDYCDWLSPVRNDKALKRLLCDAFIVWDAQMLAEIADALGDAGAARRYRDAGERLKGVWRSRYLDADGGLKSEYVCQTACAYALYVGLVDGAGKERTAAALCDDVKARNGRLGTGFLGTAIICQTLTRIGRSDLAYDLLLNREYPGWLYSVDQGATTIWERWDSYTKERGFGDASMNSFNHYAYGSVLGWLYEDAAGIRPLKPGFEEVEIAPHPDRRLGFLEAEYETPHGRISVSWRYGSDGRLKWNYSVPDGVRCKVIEPTGAERGK